MPKLLDVTYLAKRLVSLPVKCILITLTENCQDNFIPEDVHLTI